MALGMIDFIDPKLLVDMIRRPITFEPFADLIPQERWPCMVRYDDRGTFYVPREHFAFGPMRCGPSDCVWIVPGTTP